MKKGLLTLAFAATLLAPFQASAQYVRFWGPYWGPYWGGYYYNTPVVKIDTKVRDAEVFIDGAYAGTTHENKTMHLRAGRYNIEIREAGKTLFSQKVFLVPGKTLHLHPTL